MTTYTDLIERANRLIKSETAIRNIDFIRESHAIRQQARRDCACGFITHDQMIEIYRLLPEGTYEW